MRLKSFFDFLVAMNALLLLLPVFILIWVSVKCTSKGPAIHWSKRVGRNNVEFKMAKFRTMATNTPLVATDRLSDPQAYLTPIGGFLRSSSLDELPQLWNILIGDMAFVGPRPALFNQDDLVKLRIKYGVDKIAPGLTGLAQISGRDELRLSRKVALDLAYVKHQSFCFDMLIIKATILKVLSKDGIAH